MYHKIHPSKAYNSVVLLHTELGNHHQYLISEHFYHLKKKPRIHWAVSPLSLPSFNSHNYQSTFCFHTFTYLHFICTESCNLWPFMTDFLSFACCSRLIQVIVCINILFLFITKQSLLFLQIFCFLGVF
jgi:hypothetical protein